MVGNGGLYILTPREGGSSASVWDGETYDDSWYVGHEGSSEYHIYTAAQFASLVGSPYKYKLQVSDGSTVYLERDIDMGFDAGAFTYPSGISGTIHTESESNVKPALCNNIDGRFHTVRNWCVACEGDSWVNVCLWSPWEGNGTTLVERSLRNVTFDGCYLVDGTDVDGNDNRWGSFVPVAFGGSSGRLVNVGLHGCYRYDRVIEGYRIGVASEMTTWESGVVPSAYVRNLVAIGNVHAVKTVNGGVTSSDNGVYDPIVNRCAMGGGASITEDIDYTLSHGNVYAHVNLGTYIRRYGVHMTYSDQCGKVNAGTMGDAVARHNGLVMSSGDPDLSLLGPDGRFTGLNYLGEAICGA